MAAISLVCARQPALGDESIRLPQAGGEVLELTSPATRLITLSPHLTELVYAAGAGDLITATVAYSEHPQQAAALPRVGDAFRIDTERVHLLSPNLILGWQTGNPAAALSQLEELGFAVWIIEIREVDEIAHTVENIGRATGRTSAANVEATRIRNKIKEIRSIYQGVTPLDYFYQIAAQPLYTVNGEHLISQGLALCGARNVFRDLAGLAPQIGKEAVLLANPDVLIGPDIEGQPDPLEHWQDWPRMEAVARGNYLLLPADSISRATPRFIDAVELACSMLDDLR